MDPGKVIWLAECQNILNSLGGSKVQPELILGGAHETWCHKWEAY